MGFLLANTNSVDVGNKMIWMHQNAIEYRMSAQVRASIARLEARLEGIARQ